VTDISGNMTDDSGHSQKSVTFNQNGRSRSVGTTGHVQSESAVNLVRNTHPRAARRTICQIWAKVGDLEIAMHDINSSSLSEAANGEWNGPPAAQLELFRSPDN
jgi:hypothetical protein